MPGTPRRLAGPAYLTGSAANVYTVVAATYDLISEIHVANAEGTGTAYTFTLYVGATGGSTGGTEIAKVISVASGTVYKLQFYGGLKLVGGTDFLTGLASTASKLAITVLGTSNVT